MPGRQPASSRRALASRTPGEPQPRRRTGHGPYADRALRGAGPPDRGTSLSTGRRPRPSISTSSSVYSPKIPARIDDSWRTTSSVTPISIRQRINFLVGTRRSGRRMPALRAGDRRGRGHRHSDPRHRHERPYRLQRTGEASSTRAPIASSCGRRRGAAMPRCSAGTSIRSR